ncbi:MAG: hypothetical protein PGN08_09200 [Sphingomonas taxi]
MPTGTIKRAGLALLAWIAPAAPGLSQGPAPATALPPPPPTVIGMNAPEVRYYGSTVAFANLVMGSDWNNAQWERLPDKHQDAAGNILSLPADNAALRFLSVPPTDAKGIEVRCTFTGSGNLSIAGGGTPIASGKTMLRFRLVNEHGKQSPPWLVLRDVDPARPFRDLDCREAGSDPAARFRPAFLATLRGYGVIRFMDWQNANANQAVAWADRHRPGGNRTDHDGIAVEDMLALARELGAAPWFVMPWNADDDYIAHFAQMVAAQLPADQSVYVEVGNEVWNTGFSVAQQAVREGHERGLGTDDREAGMRRYAQRTVEAMRPWEAAFAGRKGLVRVLSTQHVLPQTAQIALSYRDTAAHVDAVATAPYFGSTLGGTGHTRESSLDHLKTELAATLGMVAQNRRVAAGFGKRYIGYEGGAGIALPMQVDLLDRIQHDPAMYDLYTAYLDGWRKDAGDVLCLLTSVAKPSSYGAWGLAAWEDETPAQAPKWRAVRDAIAANRSR